MTVMARWVGVVHTESGATSGWHHHGDWDTYVYIASGAQRVEFGGGGQENLLAGPGDVIHVAKGSCAPRVEPRASGDGDLRGARGQRALGGQRRRPRLLSKARPQALQRP